MALPNSNFDTTFDQFIFVRSELPSNIFITSSVLTKSQPYTQNVFNE